jgi:hypothetical protein
MGQLARRRLDPRPGVAPRVAPDLSVDRNAVRALPVCDGLDRLGPPEPVVRGADDALDELDLVSGETLALVKAIALSSSKGLSDVPPSTETAVASVSSLAACQVSSMWRWS